MVTPILVQPGVSADKGSKTQNMTKVRGLQRWRLVVLFGLGLFCMSVALLLVASTSPGRIEAWQLTWLGGLDVLTAFAVAIIGILIYAKAWNRVGNSERQISYRLATALPVTMLLAMWVFANRIMWWDVLLPGLAWRTYVVLQTLPAAIAVWKPQDSDAKNERQRHALPPL